MKRKLINEKKQQLPKERNGSLANMVLEQQVSVANAEPRSLCLRHPAALKQIEMR